MVLGVLILYNSAVITYCRAGIIICYVPKILMMFLVLIYLSNFYNLIVNE